MVDVVGFEINDGLCVGFDDLAGNCCVQFFYVLCCCFYYFCSGIFQVVDVQGGVGVCGLVYGVDEGLDGDFWFQVLCIGNCVDFDFVIVKFVVGENGFDF